MKDKEKVRVTIRIPKENTVTDEQGHLFIFDSSGDDLVEEVGKHLIISHEGKHIVKMEKI